MATCQGTSTACENVQGVCSDKFRIATNIDKSATFFPDNDEVWACNHVSPPLHPLLNETTRAAQVEIRRARYVGLRSSAEGWVRARSTDEKGGKRRIIFFSSHVHWTLGCCRDRETRQSDLWVWRCTAAGPVSSARHRRKLLVSAITGSS